MIKWLTMPWRRAFDFSGRSTRREYWIFVGTFYAGLFIMLFLLGLILPFIKPQAESPMSSTLGILITLPFLIFTLAAMIVGLSAAVRRLHDHDKSGWFILLSAIPLIGWFFFLIMMLTPGTDGGNGYGDDPRVGDPKYGGVEQIFS